MVENKYYERKIKYLDLMENGERVGGAGFVKTEVKGMDINLTIVVKGLHPTDTYERDVMLQAGDGESVMGRIALRQGQGEFRYHTVMDHSQLQGIRISLGGIREIRCKWQEERRASTVKRNAVRESIESGHGQQDNEASGNAAEEREEEKHRGSKKSREIQLIPWDEIKVVEESLERVEKMMSKPAEDSTWQAAERTAERERMGKTTAAGDLTGRGMAEGETAEGRTAGRETAERAMTEGETAEGRTAGRETAERAMTERGTTEGRTASGGTAARETLGREAAEGRTAAGGTASGETAERAAQGRETARGRTAAKARMEKGGRAGSENGWKGTAERGTAAGDKRAVRERRAEDAIGKLGRTGENAAKTGRRSMNMENRTPVRLMEDKWQQIWAIYPHIRPFQDEREYLSISPADFVLLPEEAYRAANNSFLLHGYYNYDHLILTRIDKRGEVSYYIGVPGNYYEREKQVAIMFGFESFECGTEPAQAGDFGYYMMRTQL